MEVKAKARWLRIAPRKLSLVASFIRGKSVQKVINDLSLTPKKSAKMMTKVVKSAVANAGDSVDIDSLYVKKVYVTDGGKLKRFMPRAQGRATPIFKRMSHLTIILDEK